MKKRILKAMSVMLVAATLMTGTGFNEVVTVKADTVYDENGYDAEGYDCDGYDRDGYNKRGYDRENLDKYGCYPSGYDRDGYDRYGYNRWGYDKNGYDKEGYDSAGYGKDGYNREGYDKNGYDRDGYDKNGYNRNGYDKDGYDKKGYDKNHRDRNGNVDSRMACTGYYFSMKYAHTFTNANSKISGKTWYNQKNSKMDFINNKAKQFSIYGVYVKANGKEKYVFANDYTVKVKKLNVNKNGYGKYKITITLNDKIDDYYSVTGNKIMEKTVTVVPNNEAIGSMGIKSIPMSNKYKSKVNPKTNKEWCLEMYTNNLFEGIDGVEVFISPKKDSKNSILHFKSGYKKDAWYTSNEKFDRLYDTKKSWIWSKKAFNSKKLYNYYASVRLYTNVNGKKLYSDWFIMKFNENNGFARYFTTKLNGGKRYAANLKIKKYYDEAKGQYR